MSPDRTPPPTSGAPDGASCERPARPRGAFERLGRGFIINRAKSLQSAAMVRSCRQFQMVALPAPAIRKRKRCVDRFGRSPTAGIRLARRWSLPRALRLGRSQLRRRKRVLPQAVLRRVMPPANTVASVRSLQESGQRRLVKRRHGFAAVGRAVEMAEDLLAVRRR